MPAVGVLKHWNMLFIEAVESTTVKTVKAPTRDSSGQPTLNLPPTTCTPTSYSR